MVSDPLEAEDRIEGMAQICGPSLIECWRVKSGGLMLISWECHSGGRVVRSSEGRGRPGTRPRKSEARSKILETMPI